MSESLKKVEEKEEKARCVIAWCIWKKNLKNFGIEFEVTNDDKWD